MEVVTGTLKSKLTNFKQLLYCRIKKRQNCARLFELIAIHARQHFPSNLMILCQHFI